MRSGPVAFLAAAAAVPCREPPPYGSATPDAGTGAPSSGASAGPGAVTIHDDQGCQPT